MQQGKDHYAHNLTPTCATKHPCWPSHTHTHTHYHLNHIRSLKSHTITKIPQDHLNQARSFKSSKIT